MVTQRNAPNDSVLKVLNDFVARIRRFQISEPVKGDLGIGWQPNQGPRVACMNHWKFSPDSGNLSKSINLLLFKFMLFCLSKTYQDSYPLVFQLTKETCYFCHPLELGTNSFKPSSIFLSVECRKSWKSLWSPSLKLTAKAPENWWLELEDDPFLLGFHVFWCELLVSESLRTFVLFVISFRRLSYIRCAGFFRSGCWRIFVDLDHNQVEMNISKKTAEAYAISPSWQSPVLDCFNPFSRK